MVAQKSSSVVVPKYTEAAAVRKLRARRTSFVVLHFGAHFNTHSFFGTLLDSQRAGDGSHGTSSE